MTRRLATAAVLFLAAAGAQAQQNYPDKAVRLIVPYAAGGNADLLGRVVGQKLEIGRAHV